MKRLDSKPCAVCGAPVPGRKRHNQSSYYYPKRCDECRPFARPTGEQHHNWRGGRHTGSYGYVYVRATVGGRRKRVLEHRLIWEQVNGTIPDGYDIHHVNHVRSDNRLENLMMLREADHYRQHSEDIGWARGYDRCVQCGSNTVPHEGHGLCRRCHNRKTWAKARANGVAWAHKAKYIGTWARGHDRCIDCGTSERRHAAHGRCFPCDYRWRKDQGLR